MYIDVARLNWLFPRRSMPLALLLCLATPILRAQDKEWDGHMKAGNKAQVSFNYKKAEQEYEAALARTQAFPPTDFRTALTLSKIATLYANEDKFTQAESRQKQAIAILETSAPPDDARLSCAQIGLALIYERENKREEAAPLWEGYFPILQKAARPSDPATLSTMIDLRSAMSSAMRRVPRDQDSYIETMMKRVLAIDEKVFGPDSPAAGSDAQSLGAFYEREGRHGAAYPLLLRSLEIAQKVYAKERSVSGVHRGVATAVDAVVLLPEVLLFRENVPGPFLDPHWGNASDVDRQHRELARVAFESGKYPEAEQLCREIIAGDEKVAPSSRKFDTISLDGEWVNLSRVYRHEHRYTEALDAIGRAKRSDAKGAKITDPKQVILLHWYIQNERGEIDREQGDLAAAGPLFERSLEMTNKIPLGEKHPRIAELRSDYAALLVDEGKYDEAETAYKEVLDIWAHGYSVFPVQLGQAEALANYAALLRKLNRPAEAEPLEARASAIREKASGPGPVN